MSLIEWGSCVHSIDEVIDISEPFLLLVVQESLQDDNNDDHDDHDTKWPHHCYNYGSTAVTPVQTTLVLWYDNVCNNDIRFAWRWLVGLIRVDTFTICRRVYRSCRSVSWTVSGGRCGVRHRTASGVGHCWNCCWWWRCCCCCCCCWHRCWSCCWHCCHAGSLGDHVGGWGCHVRRLGGGRRGGGSDLSVCCRGLCSCSHKKKVINLVHLLCGCLMNWVRLLE